MARWRWWIVLASVAGLALGAWAGKAKSKFPPGSGRPKADVCGSRAPGHPNAGGGSCKADADCTAGKNGRCSPHSAGPHSHIMPPNSCDYDLCASDADCKTGGPCECDGSNAAHCLAGNCKTDADCGKGGACGRSMPNGCGYEQPSYFCRTRKDGCVTDDECNKSGKGRFKRCVFMPAKAHWGCQEQPQCPVG